MKAKLAACVLFLPLSAGACGFIFSHAPPEGHEQLQYFSCTETNTGPILDIVWGGLNVLGAIGVAADPSAFDAPGPTVASGLAWGVLSGAAAGVGFNKSRRCRDAKQQLAARQAQMLQGISMRVDQPPVEAVVVNPPADTLVIDERTQLAASAHTSGGTVIPGKPFSWSSSNDAIASVSAAGLVTAYAPGAVVIAARTDNVVGTATIVVTPKH